MLRLPGLLSFVNWNSFNVHGKFSKGTAGPVGPSCEASIVQVELSGNHRPGGAIYYNGVLLDYSMGG